MAEAYKEQIGLAIATRRKALGMTQKELAEATHYKEPQSVSRWERGETLPADLELVARALHWTLSDLTRGVTPPNRKVARQLGMAIVDALPLGDSTPDLMDNLEPAWVSRLEEKLDRLISVSESTTPPGAVPDLPDEPGPLPGPTERDESTTEPSESEPEIDPGEEEQGSS